MLPVFFHLPNKQGIPGKGPRIPPLNAQLSSCRAYLGLAVALIQKKQGRACSLSFLNSLVPPLRGDQGIA